jgi:fructokinase
VIVVAGEALVDLIARPDNTIAAVPGGGPYNAARAIGRLGVPVAWAGCLSSDGFGRELEAGLAADGVALDLVQRTDLPTTLALAELDASGVATYRFYTDGTSAPALLPGTLAGGLPPTTRALHVGTLGLVLEPIATTLTALVAGLPDHVLLLVDPNCRPSIVRDPAAYRARMAQVLARADVIKVSVEDLGFLRPGEGLEAGVAWLAALRPKAILVTDGAGPVRVVTAGATHAIDVPPIDIVDTVGAGDTFGAAALACIVHDGVTRTGLDADAAVRAARFGVRAAAIACTRAGADPPTLDELGGWPA